MKLNYREINSKLATVDIKGKDYVQVNARILSFLENVPEGRITTDVVSIENGVCVFKASVFDGEKLIATGHAYEKEGNGFINKTSYIENCETSAVGRALGIAGFGIETSLASAEEVANAIKQQEAPKIGDGGVDYLNHLCEEVGSNKSEVCKYFKVKSFADMNKDQFNKACAMLEKKKAK